MSRRRRWMISRCPRPAPGGARRWTRRWTGWTLGCALLWTLASNPARAEDGLALFEKAIRPLLAKHCYECHGPETRESDLRVDTWEGMRKGGASPLFTPGKPEASLLIAAVRRQGDLKMPPETPLSKTEVADLERWVRLGAPHPDATPGSPQPRQVDLERGRRHWAFQPLSETPAPPVQGRDWIRGPLDQRILARLEASSLTPAAEADPATLIRRVTLDLTGLPPTPAEVEAYLADQRPAAYERLVDRLLASPAYGERWGRHWLDVVRYADSNGLDENIAHGNAWRYRDYVVAVFNQDVSYRQFLREQIAGDLLPAADDASRRRQLIATAFLSLGPKVLAEVDETKMEMDIIDEQLDTLGRSVLGLTFGCARCHDHKFDPITAKDYYALSGIFKSTKTMEHYTKIARWHEHSLPPTAAEARRQESLTAERTAAEQDLKRWQALQAQGGKAAGESKEDPAAKIRELTETIKRLKGEVENLSSSMGVGERETTDLKVHLRGSHLTLGELSPRRFPEVLDPSGRQLPADQSGRRELADWLTAEQASLTARVFVNRLWRWHFGRGLVASVDNFGQLGTPPTHPELLDDLAAELIRSDWSVKRLQRMIVLSSVYRMSSDLGPQAAEDPENQLWGRMPVQRLDAESLRDSLLRVAGQLDRRMGGSLLHVENREFLFNHTSEDNTRYDAPVRSLYLPVVRNNLFDVFQLFDYADASTINGDRSSSVVAPQALFLLNGGLVVEAAEGLARRTAEQAGPERRVEAIYLRALGRRPAPDETTAALEFVERFQRSVTQEDARGRAWQALCHAVLASNEFAYVR